MKIRHLNPIGLALLVVASFAGPAFASTVPVMGAGGIIASDAASLGVSGPGLSVSYSTFDYPNGVLSCTLDAVCNIGTLAVLSPVALDGLNDFPFGTGSGSFVGETANAIGGTLFLSGSALIPPVVPLGGNGIEFSLTVSGTIEGYHVYDCPGACFSNLLWTLNISGTGEANFVSHDEGPGYVYFDTMSFSFTGAATPTFVSTPELPSLVLLGTGLLGIGLGLCFRSLLFSVAR